jgi:Family of unknown function (DUF6152)
MTTEITLEGTVANFEWANPHAYVRPRETGAGG